MKRSANHKQNPPERKRPESARGKDLRELDRLADAAFEEAKRNGELLTLEQINDLVKARRAG